jgi:hypothetical protein
LRPRISGIAYLASSQVERQFVLDELPIVDARFFECRELRCSGVVNQDVQVSVLFFDLFDEILDVGCLRHVGAMQGYLRAGLRELRGDLARGAGAVDVVDADTASPRRQLSRDPGADSARATGDERHLSFERLIDLIHFDSSSLTLTVSA